MCFSFAEFKNSFLRSLTIRSIVGAKTRFFKMWHINRLHDQKFEKFFRPRPEDGLYGSNEPKKCEIRPVVSSIVHFKSFQVLFYAILSKPISCSKNRSPMQSLCLQKLNWLKSNWLNFPRNANDTYPPKNIPSFIGASFQCRTHKLEFSLQFVPLASIYNHQFEGINFQFYRNLSSSIPPNIIVYLIPCLSLFILKMCFSFDGIWKKYCATSKFKH